MEIHPRDRKKKTNNFANPAFISFFTILQLLYNGITIIALNTLVDMYISRVIKFRLVYIVRV